jgi:alpha-tubulin suppressor-like RCC1 family protein
LVHRALADDVVTLGVGTEHALCCTRPGDVYGFGWNEHGNVGDGTEVNVHTPIRLPFEPKVGVQVACGGGHSLVHTPAGIVNGSP